MTRFVIDASVAIKWVVLEEDSTAAVAVLEHCPLSAPDLLVAECSNILWKKVRRGELDSAHALLAARALQGTDVELLPTQHLLESATRLALDLDHAAYDCFYLALALESDWPFVTADMRLRRKLERAGNAGAAYQVLSMHEAVSR